jgi:hypothetical protein
MRDAALRGRTDEALVRITIPVTTTDADAEAIGRQVAGRLVTEVEKLIPS